MELASPGKPWWGFVRVRIQPGDANYRDPTVSEGMGHTDRGLHEKEVERLLAARGSGPEITAEQRCRTARRTRYQTMGEGQTESIAGDYAGLLALTTLLRSDDGHSCRIQGWRCVLSGVYLRASREGHDDKIWFRSDLGPLVLQYVVNLLGLTRENEIKPVNIEAGLSADLIGTRQTRGR